jgi:hypothetical protein
MEVFYGRNYASGLHLPAAVDDAIVTRWAFQQSLRWNNHGLTVVLEST